MEVKAGVAFDIKLPVVNLAGTLKVSGTVYVLISKAATDEVWSTGSGGQWVARASATLPSIAAPVTGGETWPYNVAAGVTNGLADMTRLFIILQDSATPGSITAISPTVEVLVRSDVPAIVGSAVGAAASVTAGVTLATDQAVNVAKWNGTTVATPTVAGVPKVEVSDYVTGKVPLQPTVAGRTLDVADTGEAGVDLSNIKQATGSTTLTNITVPTVTNVSNDVQGKVLGGGTSTITGTGVRAVDGSGNTIMAAASYTAPANADITSIKNKTDNLPPYPAATGDIPSAATVAAAVRTNFTTELGHLDADVGDCSTSDELSAVAQAILSAIGSSGGSGAAPSEIADAVVDEVLAGHVTAGSLAKIISDLLILAGSGGAYSTTLQVVDGDGDPIADVKFSLYAGGALYTTGSIGPTGVRVIGLQAAIYSIRLARAGVDVGAPMTFTVAADGETKTFTGTLVTLPVSDDPDYCRISGTLRDAGGNILADQVIRFRVVVPGAVGAATGVSVWVEVTSDSVGVFSVDLVRGTVVQVDCQPAGYNLTEKMVPDAAGRDFQAWT